MNIRRVIEKEYFIPVVKEQIRQIIMENKIDNIVIVSSFGTVLRISCRNSRKQKLMPFMAIKNIRKGF